MSPASYLAAPPRVAGPIVAPSTTIARVDWAVYGTLIAGFIAGSAAIAFLVVRILQSLRMLKRFRRHTSKELARLADLAEQTVERAATATDTAELDQSLRRLRITLRRFALLREALDEASGTFTRVTAFYPRK